MPDDNKPPAPRHFPPVYEKLIPIALGMIIFAIVILLVIIAVVLAGAR